MLNCISPEYLLSDDIRRLCGVLTLADDITDLLVTQQEVDAIGGQSQEGVVGVLHLQRRTESSGSPDFLFESGTCIGTHSEPPRLRLGNDAAGLQVEVTNAACHGKTPVNVRLTGTVPRHEAAGPLDPAHAQRC